MNPVLDAALRSWPFDPWLVVGLVAVGVVYLRGWRVYYRRDPVRWHPGRLAAFLAGLLVIFVALGSPIEPFAALLLSDLVLGFYHPVSMVANYLAFATCLALGAGWLARGRSLPRVAGAVIASSVAFFIVSNFGMWASGYYPRTWAGLVQCYTAALPFFRNTLASDALYSAVLFGGHALLARFAGRRSTETARA